MFRSDMHSLVALSILFCGLPTILAVLNQQALQLDRDCYPPYYGYVLSPNPCTCRKTNPQSEGVVQWTFPNGTVAKQVSDEQNGTSTLTAESPYKYALNQTYTCRIAAGPGQKGAELNYNPKFIFGPESASLKFAHESSGSVNLCSSKETRELVLYCEVPAATINPSPVYTAFIDGRRYGAYDKLPGQQVKEANVWRLEIKVKLNSVGNHTVSCHVRNLYAAANWFTLNQDIVVTDQPAGSQC